MTLFDFKKRLEAARSQKENTSYEIILEEQVEEIGTKQYQLDFQVRHALEKPTCFGQNVKFERLHFALKHSL